MSMNKWVRSVFFGFIGSAVLLSIVKDYRYDAYEKSCAAINGDFRRFRDCRQDADRRAMGEGSIAFAVSLPLLTLLLASKLND
jgi:hypothetical protein